MLLPEKIMMNLFYQISSGNATVIIFPEKLPDAVAGSEQ